MNGSGKSAEEQLPVRLSRENQEAKAQITVLCARKSTLTSATAPLFSSATFPTSLKSSETGPSERDHMKGKCHSGGKANQRSASLCQRQFQCNQNIRRVNKMPHWRKRTRDFQGTNFTPQPPRAENLIGTVPYWNCTSALAKQIQVSRIQSVISHPLPLFLHLCQPQTGKHLAWMPSCSAILIETSALHMLTSHAHT